MGANGISRLATKQLRQEAKLDLAASKNGLTYDLDYATGRYVGNVWTPNELPDGLLPGRPWVERMEAANPEIEIEAGGGGGAYFALSADGYNHGSSAEDIEFDTIEFQSGFSPALSGNVTTITVPSGATRLICSAWSGWDSPTELYFEIRLKKNGSVVNGFYQATHEAYYSAGHISGIIDVSGGDTIALEVNPGGFDTADFRFTGRFY